MARCHPKWSCRKPFGGKNQHAAPVFHQKVVSDFHVQDLKHQGPASWLPRSQGSVSKNQGYIRETVSRVEKHYDHDVEVVFSTSLSSACWDIIPAMVEWCSNRTFMSEPRKVLEMLVQRQNRLCYHHCPTFSPWTPRIRVYLLVFGPTPCCPIF